jgi:hypothetical protein
MEPPAALAPAGAEVRVLVDVGLIHVDQEEVLVALGADQHTLEPLDERLPPLRVGPSSGSARPRSFLAFVQDSSRRCRVARIVSRQHTISNRSPT